jgi:pyridinium-3,5-bisthiocarboxylic acid mononucleotide nickel chelatase
MDCAHHQDQEGGRRMKIAYLDCFSGVSGDMMVGALLDAGLPLDWLRSKLAGLAIGGYALEARRVGRNHIHGTRFLVHATTHEHVHRSIVDIRRILQESDISPWAKAKCIEIFQSVAEAEGKIHNCPAEEIHFHEVGAVDSIVDIAGTVLGIEHLGIRELYTSPLPLGEGFVDTHHGRIPLPAPAAVELLKGIPVKGAPVREETVTPTGAALLKGLAKGFGIMPPMVMDHVGYGVGSRTFPDRPNLLRIVIGRSSTEETDTVVILEANLDDTNPEWLGFLMERLFRAGALDCVFFPIHMKKNRPGTAVQVIGRPDQKDPLMDILFAESTTLGVRFHYSERKTLTRSSAELDSPWGKLTVKRVMRPDGSSRLLPEYEACRVLAEERNIPLQEIYYWVISANRA